MKYKNVSIRLSKTRMITFSALMAAVICVLGPISLLLPISPVPISLSILAIFAAVYAVGMKYGVVSTLLYIMLGLVGLPVFSSFSGGAGKLLGPTGGYIIGYVFTALIAGAFIDRFENRRALQIVGMALGVFVCYVFGTAWLAYQGGMSFSAALVAGVIPFIPADCVKIAIAAAFGPKLRAAVRKAAAQGERDA